MPVPHYRSILSCCVDWTTNYHNGELKKKKPLWFKGFCTLFDFAGSGESRGSGLECWNYVNQQLQMYG